MMKKTLLLVALTVMSITGASAQMLVLNEVYPGGGASSGTPAYTRDFVEIYNLSAIPFSLAGYSLQYAPASSATFSGTILAFGTGSVIGGNDYLTISTGSAGSAGATLAAGTGAGFATYINTNGASLSATSGSVRLYNTATSTTIDLLGYGTLTNATGDPKMEGTVAASPTSTAVSLNRTGFADTNNNAADFSSMTPTPNAGTTSVVVVATGVPEPSTWAFVTGGLGISCLFLRRRLV